MLDFEFVSTNSSIRAGMTQAICGLRQSLDAVLPGAMIISSTFAGAYPSFEWDWPAITKCLDLIMPMNYGLCSASDLNKDKTAFQRIFVQDVRKCEDMLRIIRYLKGLHATEKIRTTTEEDAPREKVNSAELHEKLLELERELKEHTERYSQLSKQRNELEEHSAVLQKASTWFGQVRPPSIDHTTTINLYQPLSTYIHLVSTSYQPHIILRQPHFNLHRHHINLVSTSYQSLSSYIDLQSTSMSA